MPGFNLLTKALFSFQLGGLEGLELHNLWPDRNQQSTMIWLEAPAASACSVALAPPSLKESQASRSVLLYVCACMCVLCSNCVGSTLPTEH